MCIRDRFPYRRIIRTKTNMVQARPQLGEGILEHNKGKLSKLGKPSKLGKVSKLGKPGKLSKARSQTV